MKSLLRILILLGTAGILPAALAPLRMAGQDPGKPPQIAVDPQTGRAVGAKEIAPDELQKLIAQKAKMIIIDVRDDAQYRQETIKGAIHIPFADVKARLKDIPKDTVLVFT